MDQMENRVWAEIDLAAIEENYQKICASVGVPVLCVVKADAYGHGAVQVAGRLSAAGAPYFAVATVDEAIELRTSGIQTPILLLGFATPTDMERAALYQITLQVGDCQTAHLVAAAARRVGKPIVVHFKVDTGMTRLGFDGTRPAQTVREILACAAYEGVQPEGIFTHFAASDTEEGRAYTALQYGRFLAVCDGLANAGLSLPLRHCANSGAILYHPDKRCDMVRAGILLYGYRPDAQGALSLPLRPAMTLKARVAQVRHIDAHTSISYGRTHQTDAPCEVAVVTMGYADGLLRSGSGQAHMVLGGVRAPILGRICMDMCMVQVPHGVKVARGDEVTVFGPEVWTAEDNARAAGTISYEVLCALSHRVPRIAKNHLRETHQGGCVAKQTKA